MKNILSKIPVAVGALILLWSANTNGVTTSGFQGDFAPSNWTLEETGANTDGFVILDDVPNSITLVGGDNASQLETPGLPGLTVWRLKDGFPGYGPVQFHWEYQSDDAADPADDYAGYLLNGSYVFLSDLWFGDSGDVSITVGAGQSFGFWVATDENNFGPGELKISQFVATVPDGGSTLALLSFGFLGLTGLNRRFLKA